MKAHTKIANHLHDLKANGAIIRLTGNTLTLVYEDNIFDSDVLHNHRFGEIEYGIFQRDHIPVLLIAFGTTQYDFWINAYDLLPAIYRHHLNNYSGSVCFALLSSKTRQVAVERIFHFNSHFVGHLKSCLQQQWMYYHNEFEVKEKVLELTETASTELMFTKSKRYVCPGKTRHRHSAKK